jgi:hypothetical protein
MSVAETPPAETQSPARAEPTPEHRWLERMVGDWDFVAEAAMGEGLPPMRSEGTERVRSLGGVWIVAEGEGDAPDGGAATNIITLGYDPARGRYVGSFVSSFMTSFWTYEGTLEGDRLVLDTEGPSFTGEGLSRYQDVVEFVDDDHRVLRSRAPTPDGGWMEFMTARYTRRK